MRKDRRLGQGYRMDRMKSRKIGIAAKTANRVILLCREVLLL
jgi:hypothetical protein